MIHIIHHKRTVGKPNTVYVGRPSVLGNPFTHIAKSTLADVLVSTPDEAVERYEEWLDEQVDNGNEGVIQALTDIMNLELEHGVVHLSCWCKDEVNPFSTDREFCHADVIRNFILDEIDAANAEEQ